MILYVKDTLPLLEISTRLQNLLADGWEVTKLQYRAQGGTNNSFVEVSIEHKQQACETCGWIGSRVSCGRPDCMD